jgi:hypothetical protein
MGEQSLSGAAALDSVPIGAAGSSDNAGSGERHSPRATANAGGHAAATGNASAFEAGTTPQASGAASGSAAADASISH